MFKEIGKENLALNDKNMLEVGQNRFHWPVTAILQCSWPQFPLSSVGFSDPPESLGLTGWKRQAYSIYNSTKFGQISEANRVSLFPTQIIKDDLSASILTALHLLLFLQLEFILLFNNFFLIEVFWNKSVLCKQS